MAKIFRLQENVPDVYTRKSRDFQLLCNVFDILQGGIKYDIDTITSVVDTRYCSEKLLPLLQSKLGFYTEKHLNATELRTVLTSFMHLCKDKGSIKGIREAIELYLRVIGASRKSRVDITNSVKDTITDRILHNSSYIVQVLIEGQITDITLLTELLRYVLPAGYRLNYSFYQSLDAVEYIVERGTVNIVIASSSVNNRIAGHSSDDVDDRLLKYVFATGDIHTDAIYYIYNGTNYISSVDGNNFTGEYIIDNDSMVNIEQSAIFDKVKYGDIYPVVCTKTDDNLELTYPVMYYQGKDLSEERDYTWLINEGIIANLFTHKAEGKIYVERTDAAGMPYVESVKVGEEYFTSYDYYIPTGSDDWGDWTDSNTEYTPQSSTETYYKLTTKISKLFNLEIFECTCIYNKADVPLDVEDTFYRVKSGTEPSYRFKANQQVYYTKDTTTLTSPSAISTSTVVNTVSTGLPKTVLPEPTTTISFTDTQAGYVLDYIENIDKE